MTYLEYRMMILLRVDFIAFIVYVFAGKALLDYTNFFLPTTKKNEKTIYKYFKDKYGKRKRKL